MVRAGRGGVLLSAGDHHTKLTTPFPLQAYVEGLGYETPGDTNIADHVMNPDLDRLHPYPFERLRALLAGATPAKIAVYKPPS